MSPAPAPSSPWWGGHTAADGTVVHWVCTGGLVPSVVTPFFQANGAAAPVDPAVLTYQATQEAYKKLPITDPAMEFGPDPQKIAVNFWTTLSVGNPGPVSATATAGTVSVTANASVTSVTWSMGEPATLPGTNPPASTQRWPSGCTVGSSAPVTFTCPGPGVQLVSASGLSAPAWPAYGYDFQWRSLKARTGGSGSWPVTATTTWTINWTSTTGATGTLTTTRTNTTQISVGEFRTARGYSTGG